MGTYGGRTAYLIDAMNKEMLNNVALTRPANFYLRATNTEPTATTPGTEQTAAGCTPIAVPRDAVTFMTSITAAQGTGVNKLRFVFPDATADYLDTIKGAELWDAPTGGNRWYWAVFVRYDSATSSFVKDPKTIRKGDSLQVAPSQMQFYEE